MKEIIFLLFLYLIPVTALAQATNVTVEIIRADDRISAEWQVLDEHYRTLWSSGEFSFNDTAKFSLIADKRYFLQISINDITTVDTALYSMIINGEPVLRINSRISEGDHFFPFHTGIKEPVTKITGGTSASISDLPWQIYLVSGNQRCGGAIISPEWVVTAAHCVKSSTGTIIPPSSMYIKAGATNPGDSNTGKIYLVSDVIVHEKYNSSSNENDIALLKLNAPINIENARPIKLITPQDSAWGYTDPGVMAWISGWGLTSINPSVYPTSLQKAQIPIVSKEQASSVWNNIPLSVVMAGYRNGGKDACMGDSGGPLSVPVEGDFKLAGVVSWGSDKCNTYGAYTRISTFESWIRSKTGIPKEFVAPPPAGDTLICQGTTSDSYTAITVPGATSYEWQLSPSEAGTITGTFRNATVYWNSGFTGRATIRLRVTADGKISEWSVLRVNVVKNTRLLNQSASAVICAGENLKLFARAEGYNLVYRWFLNGRLVQSGISDEFNISGATSANAGNYRAEITGTCGSISSAVINVEVLPTTMITNISRDQRVMLGEDVTLEVSSGGHNLIYTWHKDDVAINNSNTPQLLLQNVNARHIGLYKVSVAGTCGTEISQPVYLYITRGNPSGYDVFIWPTISNNEINVAISNEETYIISIFDLTGRHVREIRQRRYQTSVNIADLPAGMYIINVHNRNFRISHKVIKN